MTALIQLLCMRAYVSLLDMFHITVKGYVEAVRMAGFDNF